MEFPLTPVEARSAKQVHGSKNKTGVKNKYPLCSGAICRGRWPDQVTIMPLHGAQFYLTLYSCDACFLDLGILFLDLCIF